MQITTQNFRVQEGPAHAGMPAGFDNGPRLLVAGNPAIENGGRNHHRGLLTR
jgi:hypothetical protein